MEALSGEIQIFEDLLIPFGNEIPTLRSSVCDQNLTKLLNVLEIAKYIVNDIQKLIKWKYLSSLLYFV